MAGKRAAKVWLCTAGVVFVTASAHATITVDGTLNESDYGTSAPGTSALATQTVASSFGSNQLDAAYAVTENGNLYLFIAGQAQNNGNAVQIWFDDGRAGGQNTLNAATGAGNMNKMNGSLFSPDFHATYALEMNVSGTTFNLDQYNLLSTTATFLGSFPLTNGQGSAANLQGIAAGFNNNLTGGITTGSANHGSAVDSAAAQAVNTGIELAIPLSTFGNPSNIKVMVALNGNGDSGLSNQVLPGVQVGTDNIKTQPGTLVGGQPAVNPYYLGTTGNSTEFSFANFPGQYFTVPVPVIPNGNWLPPGGGSWGTAGNWSNSIIPGIGGDAATFTTATGASAVMLDGTRTIGALTINSSNSYTFAAGTGGVLVMDNAGSQAAINDLGGVHIISAPVVLNSDTIITEQNHGDAMTISGNISGPAGLIVSNSGVFNATHSTVVLSGNNSYAGPTTIARGEIQLGSSTGLPAGTALTMSSSSPHAVLDLNGFGAVVSSLTVTGAAAGAQPLATITTSSTTSGLSTFTYAGSAANPNEFKGTLSDNASAGGGTLALVVASGSLTLSGNNSYTGGTTISSGATATFASVLVDPNSHLITGTALPINSTVLNSGSLVIGNSATANGIVGSGSTTVTGATLTAATIAQGSLAIANDSSRVLLAQNGLSVVAVSALSVGDNTSSANAQLDLNDNALKVSYSGASPVDSIRALLTEGFNAGSWDGNGIASTVAHNDAAMQHALGYRDTGSEVDVTYTFYGDNNLDGTVNTGDFQMLLDGLASGGSSWSQGDYTYDGVVDLGNDVTLFLENYLSLGGSQGALAAIVEGDTNLSSVQKAQLLAAVPEPSSLLIACSAACVFAARRRRN